jgi:hypothetical protein
VPRRHLRNHHHGIRVMTDYGEVRLLTIGYLAVALGRTRGTILKWERMKLLPPVPYVINPLQHRGKRRLYPEDYVRELGRITAKHYPGHRLERESWRGFQNHVYAAYNDLVMPHLGGVNPPMEIEVDAGQEAGLTPGNEGLSTTTNDQ